MPLRQPALPRHDAGAQALRARARAQRPGAQPFAMVAGSSTHLRWEAESLWERLVPLLPHLSVEVLARCESTNSLLVERARRAGGDLEATVTVPGELTTLAEDAQASAPEGATEGAAAARRVGGRAAAQAGTRHGRREGDTDPCLLVAEQQTRGRGRLGRPWLAAPGASLTFSLALPLAPRDWSGLSLAVGLALAEALDSDQSRPAGAPPRIALKWPNDLWLLEGAPPGAAGEASAPVDAGAAGGVDARVAGAPGTRVGAKLGGILIETVNVGRRRLCVVGIGLNVQPLPPSLAGDLGVAGHACLQSIDAQASAPGALSQVALPLVQALQAFEREGFAPLAVRYAARDLLRGQPVTTTLADLPSGTAEGVDESGALLVRAGGQVRRVVSGEVSVRRAPAAGAGTSPASGPA